jgi:hypothetical protein
MGKDDAMTRARFAAYVVFALFCGMLSASTASAQSTTRYYAYCGAGGANDNIYYSDVFPVDVKSLNATPTATDQAAAVKPVQAAFLNYVSRKYPAAQLSGTGCPLFNTTADAEADKKTVEGQYTDRKFTIIETGWKL